MNRSQTFFVFSCDHHRCALPVEAVERVIPIVELTAFTPASPPFAGVVIMQGEEVPVVDLSRMAQTKATEVERELELNDRLVIARGAQNRIAFIATVTHGVETRATTNDATSPAYIGLLNATATIYDPQHFAVLWNELETQQTLTNSTDDTPHERAVCR